MDNLPEFERWERIDTGYDDEFEWQRGRYLVSCSRIRGEWVISGLEPMDCEDGEILIHDKFLRDGIYNYEAVPSAIRAVINTMNEELSFEE